MFTVRTEVPSGAVSRGYEFAEEGEAIKALSSIKDQIRLMRFPYALDVLMEEDGVLLVRETVDAAQ